MEKTADLIHGAGLVRKSKEQEIQEIVKDLDHAIEWLYNLIKE